MGTKRSAINIDPDYEDVTEHHNKRQRLLEEDAKETTRKKIEKIICDQFIIEEMQKEREVEIIDQKLHQARQMMDRLRACIVANFYSSAGQQKMFQVKSGVQQQQQLAIHPTVKEHLGKKPKFTDSMMSEKNMEDMIWKNKFSTSVKLESRCNIEVKKEPVEEAQETSNSAVPDQSTSRTSRFKVKKRIIVGNVSKYIPVDKREENDQSTHKWMVYVRGSKDEPKIDHFVKKVWFFLHPSYRPNDLVEVSQPPFHLTRRGWGEFPVRIQLHFYDQRNKRVDIIHPLKLDRTYTGLQTLGAETVVDVELEREKTATSTLPGVVSMDATSMFKFGRKDGIKLETGLKNEQNFTIAEQITPKKIKTDSELYKRLSEGQVTPKTKGKITPSPKGAFSDLFNSKSSPSSKGVDNISQDNSNLSNKENFYEGVGKLQESPSKGEGNMQPQQLNIVTPVLKAGGLVGENIVKQSSSVGQSQNASYSSMVTPTGIITVNKVTDGSGLSAFTQSSSNVQVVLGGFGSLTSPGVSDAKSPIIASNAGSTLNPGVTDNKHSLILGSTSSSTKSETLILAANSPSQSPSIMNKKAKSKTVSPAKPSTSQSSSTIILQGMGSLSKSSVTGGNKNSNNNNGLNVSSGSPSSESVSPVKSASIENSVSNQSSLYIRCRDNQGNIFLVPQHLLKQITNPTADKTHTPTGVSSSGMVSLPQNTVTSSLVLPQQQVVQSSSSTSPNKNDNLATSILSSSLKTAKPESQNISFSGSLGKSSPSKSLPATGKVTEGIKNSSPSIVKQQTSAPQSLISGSVINSQSRSESPSSAALKMSTPQILVRFPQGDELNNSSGTSLLNSSQLPSGSGNVAPGSPRGQLKVTSQGLKVVPTSIPSVTIDRTGNMISGMKPSQQQTSVLKFDKQATRKSMTVSALLKENASQNKHSLVKNTQISSLKPGQSGEPSSEMKLVAITTNSDSKTPMLVLASQDKNTGSNVKQVTQNLGTKVNSPEKQRSSYNFVLSNSKDGGQCLSLLSSKPSVVSSNVSSKPSTSHNVSTNSSKPTPTYSGSALTNTPKGQSVTLNLTQGQSSSLISGQQSKTVLATIGNQTLLLQLPVSEVKTSEGASLSLLPGNQSSSRTVVKETTSKLSNNKSENDKVIAKPASEITEQYEPMTSSREPEKKIFVWKKKKCYETAPVPPKEIPPIRVIDFPDVMSLVRAAVKRHPVVCTEVDVSQHPYCAKTIEDWLSWNIGKRRASEWQRASAVRRFIMQQIGGLDTFKGTQLWSIKQIMTWCRLHAYSPHYLEKTLHPTPLELSADSNTMGKKFSSSTDSTTVLLQLHDVQSSSRSDDNSDDEIDIIGIEPPKVKIKEEPSEIKVCDNPTSLPPSDEAVFIQDTALKIGVKFEPSEVTPEVFTSTSEDLIFNAMESFISELLTETFALKVNLGRYPDGIGVGDVYKALSSRSKFDFLTNRHLGVKDVTTDTVPR